MFDHAVAGLGFEGANHGVESTFGKFRHAPTNRTDNPMGMLMIAHDIAVAFGQTVDALHDANVGIEFEGAKQASITQGIALGSKGLRQLGCRKGSDIGSGCVEHCYTGRGGFVACATNTLDGVVHVVGVANCEWSHRCPP